MPFTAAEIASQLQGKVVGNPQVTLKGFAPADSAKSGDLTFAENEEYFARAEQSAASAIIVSGAMASNSKVLIRVKNARVAFAKALELFFPSPVQAAGVHPSAVVDPEAQIHPSAHIGPNCVVEARSKIGARTALLAGVCVASDCKIGEDCVLFPHVTVYARTEIGDRVRVHAGTVLGSDGFGYVQDNGVHRKVPQIGNVIIGEDVEIGANVTIDRGALGATVIGKGTKIDNLVQIAHNVRIGEHCLLVAQVGIAGSTKLGNYVVLAGQVGLAGHLTIGDQVMVAAQAGVMDNIPAGEKWWGAPAQPSREVKRQVIALRQLPEVLRRIANLEKKDDAK
jgi:UDP-3-O-[3-hydroxymyristoyl] glucosamine N-acyltransferase